MTSLYLSLSPPSSSTSRTREHLSSASLICVNALTNSNPPTQRENPRHIVAAVRSHCRWHSAQSHRSRHGNLQKLRQLLQSARAEAVLACFVFMNLLES